jgi:2-polyprenyl-6-hydroxyphenyl methylase/3-demethylubiquinone-9 3-methyltransferase
MVSIEQYYETYWDRPEDYNDPTTPARFALLRRHLANLAKGAPIIDVGCGRGEFCQFFKEMGFAPQGIDISHNVIRFAREHHPGITFHEGEVQQLLPAHVGEFQAAFSSEVIEHLFDVEGYLKCVNRLLKPGGTLVVTTPYHGWLKNMIVDTFNYSKHYDPAGQHIRFFDKKSLGLCLRRCGFEPLVWSGYGRPWPMWKSFFVVAKKASEPQDQSELK